MPTKDEYKIVGLDEIGFISVENSQSLKDKYISISKKNEIINILNEISKAISQQSSEHIEIRLEETRREVEEYVDVILSIESNLLLLTVPHLLIDLLIKPETHLSTYILKACNKFVEDILPFSQVKVTKITSSPKFKILEDSAQHELTLKSDKLKTIDLSTLIKSRRYHSKVIVPTSTLDQLKLENDVKLTKCFQNLNISTKLTSKISLNRQKLKISEKIPLRNNKDQSISIASNCRCLKYNKKLQYLNNNTNSLLKLRI